MIYSKYKLYQDRPDDAEPTGKPERVRRRESALEFEVERLLMITEAMWSLLSEHHGYSEEDLLRRVYEVDAEDGRIDGQKDSEASTKCLSCARTLMRGRPKCIYCGTLSPRAVFER